MNFFDDKRIQCNDKITTYPYGHFDNTSNINDEIKNNTKDLIKLIIVVLYQKIIILKTLCKKILLIKILLLIIMQIYMQIVQTLNIIPYTLNYLHF